MSVGLNVGLNWLVVRLVFFSFSFIGQSFVSLQPSLQPSSPNPHLPALTPARRLFIHGGIFGWKGLGFIGSPIATSVSQILLVLALYGYVSKRRVLARIWPGWRRECISKRRSAIFLKQALPLMVGQAVEEWQIQVITGFAGRLGKTQIATHNALLELFFWLSAGMFGILQGTSVRCAFHLGNADVEGAKRVSRVALASALGLGLIVASVLIGARNYIGYIYSHDHAVVKETGKISWVVGVSYDLLSCAFLETMGIAYAPQTNPPPRPKKKSSMWRWPFCRRRRGPTTWPWPFSLVRGSFPCHSLIC